MSAFAGPAATAQTPDTLDWRRYYPLAVGNVWEYHDAEMIGVQFRHTLVSDTVADGRTYFRRRTDRATAVTGPDGPDTLRSVAFDVVRYDDGGGVVALAGVEADTAAVRLCAEDGFERDLRLGFGEIVACGLAPGPLPGPDSARVAGVYDTVWTPDVLSGPAVQVAVAAVKYYTVGHVIFSTFAADVGPVGTGNLWGPRLHYAVVGGVAYGSPAFAVGSEADRPRADAFEVRVLGNPSRGGVAFHVRSIRVGRTDVAVYDVLGRRVWTMDGVVSGAWTRVDIPGGALTAGTYVFAVSSAGGERRSIPFTVVE